MTALTPTEAEALGVDPERAWLREVCPNGHEGIFEDHPSTEDSPGSEASCSTCGARFAYGQYAAALVAAEAAAQSAAEPANTRADLAEDADLADHLETS